MYTCGCVYIILIIVMLIMMILLLHKVKALVQM